jgi:FkbM family methyltransferase
MAEPDLPPEGPNRGELLAQGRVIEAATDIGPLLLERDAALLTPGILQFGTYAPETANLMRRHLRPGMTVVDAGANIGYLSSLASQLVGPDGRVFSVEVDPKNQEILRENLRSLGRDNWEVLPVAAWHEDGTLNLVTGEQGGAGSTVWESSGDHEVPAARLDTLIDGTVDYLKVDCESTDHLVVQGAEDLIRRNPSMLISVEFNPGFTGHTGYGPAQIVDLYRGLGLTPWEIKRTGRLKKMRFSQIPEPQSADDVPVAIDFALCAGTPPRRRLTTSWMKTGLVDPALAFGGNLLEHVPERVRPKVRTRDRRES